MTPDERRDRRDLFTAAALIGILARGSIDVRDRKIVTQYAIAQADDVMIALDEPTTEPNNTPTETANHEQN